MTIRPIDANSADEIGLVARRMRETLIEVLGEQRGAALYSIDELLQRVRWHLDPAATTAKIFVTEDVRGAIIAHAIARIEVDENGDRYGYFSTVFVEPGSRAKGVGTSLIREVEAWLKSMNMPRIVYNTAADHAKLIRLFGRHGFRITLRADEMVQLKKQLD